MKQNIWNFWANKYDKLWVQKYSLKPTRDYILNDLAFNQIKGEKIKVLDLGCGPGELIQELENKFDNVQITGIDFSDEMLKISKNKNSQVHHINMDVADLDELDDKFDIIICTHSLPYYKNLIKVIKELDRLLKDNGKIYIGFASGNSLYDKIALSFVKITTGPANYPSDAKFKEIIEPYFNIGNFRIIKERFFMPRIAVYTLRKKRI